MHISIQNYNSNIHVPQCSLQRYSQETRHGKNSNVHQNEWIKMSYIHIYIHTYTQTHNRILLRHKKEWNNAICSNMDVPRDYYTKWSKSEKERQKPYGIAYMQNLKYDTNELIYKTETDSQTRRRDSGCQGGQGGGGGKGWEFGMNRCKLAYTEGIKTRSYCSTGNSTQYRVINHNGKE